MRLGKGDGVPLTFAAVIAAVMVWRELLWWWRVQRWALTEGKVVGFDAEDGLCPEVEFQKDGESIRFTGSFALWNPEIGESIPVLSDPGSERAKIYTTRHRWFLTAFAIFSIVGCLAIVWLSP